MIEFKINNKVVKNRPIIWSFVGKDKQFHSLPSNLEKNIITKANIYNIKKPKINVHNGEVKGCKFVKKISKNESRRTATANDINDLLTKYIAGEESDLSKIDNDS